MKLVIEPERLRRFLECLLMGKGTKTNLKAVTPTFGPDGVVLSRLGEGGATAVYAAYKPTFFMEYEVLEEENVTLTSTLLEAVRKNFNKDQKITLTTTDSQIIVEGSVGEYREELSEEIHEPITFELEDTEYGVIVPRPATHILVKSEELRIGSVPECTLEFDGELLKMTSKEGISQYTQKVKPLKFEGEATKILLSGDLFHRLVNLVSGEVWVNIYAGALILSEKKKDYSLTYVMGAKAR